MARESTHVFFGESTHVDRPKRTSPRVRGSGVVRYEYPLDRSPG